MNKATESLRRKSQSNGITIDYFSALSADKISKSLLFCIGVSEHESEKSKEKPTQICLNYMTRKMQTKEENGRKLSVRIQFFLRKHPMKGLILLLA